MGDDRAQALKLELMKGVIECGGYREVPEFDQQVSLLIQSESGWLGAEGLEVLVTQMEVATCGNLETVAQLCLNLISPLANQIGNKAELAVRVRGGDHMCDALGDGRCCHFQGHFQSFRAVIKTRQDVAVDVNHGSVKIAHSRMAEKDKSRVKIKSMPRLNVCINLCDEAFIGIEDVAIVLAVDPFSDIANAARTTDLSLGGCYIDSVNPLPPGSLITIELVHKGESFHAMGQIVYSQPNMGMGIKFVEVKRETQEILVRWIEELQTAQSPA